jgi:hypothetical protein
MNFRTGLLFQNAATKGLRPGRRKAGAPGSGAVDKALAQPYLCQRRVSGECAHFAAFFAAEPWID